MPQEITSPCELRDFLASRNFAELGEMAKFWLEPGRAMTPADDDRLQKALADAMSKREVIAGRLSYLHHDERRLLRDVANSPGHHCMRERLLERPVGATPVDPVMLDRSLDRLRERGFIEVLRGASWGVGGKQQLRVPTELARKLREVLGGELRAIDRHTSCGAYLRSLSHNQLQERLAKVSRAGGREEQIKRAIARCRSITEVDRKLEMLPPELATAVHIVRDEFFGLAFRDELAERLPDVEARWDGETWRDIMEEHLLGTVGFFSLADHGMKRHGEAMVVFSEVVAGTRPRPAAEPEPKQTRRLDFAFVALVDRLLAVARLEGLKVTQKDRLLFKGSRRRLLDGFAAGRADRLVDEDEIAEAALRFAAREGLVDVDGDQRLTVEPDAAKWLRQSEGVRLRRVLFTLLEEAVTLARAPVSSDMIVEILRSLSSTAWSDAGSFHRRFRSILAGMRLPERRTLIHEGSMLGEAARDPTSTGVEIRLDSLAGLFAAFLAPFFYAGCLEVGVAADGGTAEKPALRMTHLRLTDAFDRILGAEELDRIGADEKVLIVNPDFEVMVFAPPGIGGMVLLNELERLADYRGGEGMVRFHLTRDSVRRAVVLEQTGEDVVEALARHARAPLPSNVLYNLREWSQSVEFVSPRTVLLLRARSAGAAERIQMLASSRGLSVERIGERDVLLPPDVLHGDVGQALIDALRDTGVLLDSGDGSRSAPSHPDDAHPARSHPDQQEEEEEASSGQTPASRPRADDVEAESA